MKDHGVWPRLRLEIVGTVKNWLDQTDTVPRSSELWRIQRIHTEQQKRPWSIAETVHTNLEKQQTPWKIYSILCVFPHFPSSFCWHMWSEASIVVNVETSQEPMPIVSPTSPTASTILNSHSASALHWNRNRRGVHSAGVGYVRHPR